MATYLFQCKDILFCYLSSILPLHFAKPFDQFNLQRDLQLHDCSNAKFLLLIIIYEKKKSEKDRSKHKGICRKQKGGKSISSLHRSREAIICLKDLPRGQVWIDISHNISETFIVHGIAAVSLNFDVSPYLANALHWCTRDTAVRHSPRDSTGCKLARK